MVCSANTNIFQTGNQTEVSGLPAANIDHSLAATGNRTGVPRYRAAIIDQSFAPTTRIKPGLQITCSQYRPESCIDRESNQVSRLQAANIDQSRALTGNRTGVSRLHAAIIDQICAPTKNQTRCPDNVQPPGIEPRSPDYKQPLGIVIPQTFLA